MLIVASELRLLTETSADRLRGIVSPDDRCRGLRLAAATEQGILAVQGARTQKNVESMTEATVLLILAVLYDLHGSEAVLCDNRFGRPKCTPGCPAARPSA